MSGTMGGISPVTTYLNDTKNESKQVASFQATDPQTKSDIAYFEKVAPKLTTVDALMKDYRALTIVLNAFGMSSDIIYPALVKKVLTQDPTKSSSLAQQMASPSYFRAGQAMGQWKTPPFSSASNIAAVVSAYATNSYETQQATATPGMDTALYFKRNASGITTINGLMSDAKMLSVVVASLNLSSSFGSLDYSQQVTILTKAVKLKDFTSPAKVNQMAESYLIQNSQQSSTSVSDPTGALAILSGISSSSSNSDPILSALSGNSSAAAGSLVSLFA